MPRDYSKGKIYCLRSYQTDLIYIGSTVQDLKDRMYSHRTNKATTAKEIMKYPDAYIELIENYPCNSKNELDKREGEIQREYIAKQLAVNKNISGRSKQEWREDNKEYNKKYYEENKDKIKEIQKEYVKQNYKKVKEKQNEWIKNNREHYLETKKIYREKNDEYIKQKIQCSCGNIIRRTALSGHLKTEKHDRYLNRLLVKQLPKL